MHNPNFSASDVHSEPCCVTIMFSCLNANRKTIYLVHVSLVLFFLSVAANYTSLCQDEAQKRKGLYAQRKIQRCRRERVVRV